jgi:uncharacterized protein YukE
MAFDVGQAITDLVEPFRPLFMYFGLPDPALDIQALRTNDEGIRQAAHDLDTISQKVTAIKQDFAGIGRDVAAAWEGTSAGVFQRYLIEFESWLADVSAVFAREAAMLVALAQKLVEIKDRIYNQLLTTLERFAAPTVVVEAIIIGLKGGDGASGGYGESIVSGIGAIVTLGISSWVSSAVQYSKLIRDLKALTTAGANLASPAAISGTSGLETPASGSGQQPAKDAWKPAVSTK